MAVAETLVHAAYQMAALGKSFVAAAFRLWQSAGTPCRQLVSGFGKKRWRLDRMGSILLEAGVQRFLREK